MNGVANSWTSYFDRALGWIYPGKCPLCGLLADSSPCAGCAADMPPARPDYLVETGGDLAFRACRYAYESRAAQAVRRLKYSRSTALVQFMSQTVLSRLQELHVEDELIVPVPINRVRQAWRGFNQAELLTSEFSGLNVQPNALKRTRNTRPQVGLNLAERQANLSGAFSADACVAGHEVVLIDDVVTSGQTARECARVLLEGGAISVGVVAFSGNLL